MPGQPIWDLTNLTEAKLLPWWQQCHSLWCSDSHWKTDRRLISFAQKRKTCSFQSTLLVHMQMEWHIFFWSSLHGGKKTSLIITWSKWGEIVGFQAYQGPLPCRPYTLAAAICPSFHLITATWGKKPIKTAWKFIKGWLILFLLTGWVHIFHAWACISSEREEEALALRLFPAWPLFVNRQSLWHTNLASKGFTLHRPQGLEAFQAYKTHLSSTKASGY